MRIPPNTRRQAIFFAVRVPRGLVPIYMSESAATREMGLSRMTVEAA